MFSHRHRRRDHPRREVRRPGAGHGQAGTDHPTAAGTLSSACATGERLIANTEASLPGQIMQRHRPTSVLVIAIFHFIFAAFGLIGGLVGIGFGVMTLTQPHQAAGYVVASNPPTMTDTMKYMDS